MIDEVKACFAKHIPAIELLMMLAEVVDGCLMRRVTRTTTSS